MKRSKFSLSHTKLLSANMGYLIPITWFEVLPGDTIQHATNLLVRASPLLAPVMHRVDVRIHHWYVPNRLVWEDWEDFITGGPDGMDSTTHPFKQMNGRTVNESDLCSYLGVPAGSYPATANPVNALPCRVYNMIWNENYRDQDLQTAENISIDSGTDNTTNDTVVKRVCWEKDYLTSARPWEMKGPSITIPIGDTAPLIIDPAAGAIAPSEVRVSGTGNLAGTTDNLRTNASGVFEGATAGLDYSLDITPHTLADLSTASAVTINVLREAFALQRYQEARARFGSRYVEYLAYLGVRALDARLQRPEYLGGGRQTIQFSEVLQTAEGTAPVGALLGHGITGVRSNRYRRFFQEHGIVMSLMSVRPKTIYTQALHRQWLRSTKEDYWQKELEHIGQQTVQNREAYGIHATPLGEFGFQDRYDEYRRMESSVAGEFQTSTLNHWHLARDFGSPPALNSDFVQCSPAQDRVFAVPSEDVLYVMANHSIQARRMLAPRGNSFIF